MKRISRGTLPATFLATLMLAGAGGYAVGHAHPTGNCAYGNTVITDGTSVTSATPHVDLWCDHGVVNRFDPRTGVIIP